MIGRSFLYTDRFLIVSVIHLVFLICLWLGVSLTFAAASDFGMSYVQGLQFGTIQGAQAGDLKTMIVSSSETLISFIQTVAGVLAVLMLVWYGFKAVMSPEDGWASVKKGLTGVIIGLIIMVLARPFVVLLWGGNEKLDSIGQVQVDAAGTYLNSLSWQAFQWIFFFESLLAALAVLIIIYNGAKIVLSTDSGAKDKALSMIKNMVIGMFLIVFAHQIVSLVYINVSRDGRVSAETPGLNVDGVFTTMTGLTNFLLQFLSAFMVLYIIYGGYKYIMWDKASIKTLVVNMIVGTMIIVFSYAFVAFLLPS